MYNRKRLITIAIFFIIVIIIVGLIIYKKARTDVITNPDIKRPASPLYVNNLLDKYISSDELSKANPDKKVESTSFSIYIPNYRQLIDRSNEFSGVSTYKDLEAYMVLITDTTDKLNSISITVDKTDIKTIDDAYCKSEAQKITNSNTDGLVTEYEYTVKESEGKYCEITYKKTLNSNGSEYLNFKKLFISKNTNKLVVVVASFLKDSSQKALLYKVVDSTR